jgi:hypothetical protein
MIYLMLAFGLLIGIAHYFSRRLKMEGPNKMKLLSLSSGVFITYLFLHMFPELYEIDVMLNKTSLVFVLIGFSIFHILEKYIYKHSKSTNTLKRELKEVHAVSLFIYYFVIGIAIVNLGEYIGTLEMILFIVPVLVHAALSSISFGETHAVAKGAPIIRLFVSSSTLLGILMAYSLGILRIAHYAIVGSILGMLLYITIVDSIPKEKEGEPAYFLLGVVIYAIIIGFSWSI